MSFVVYFFVLLITIGSVAFGLDWVQAPMPPAPPSTYELRAAKPPEQPKPAVAAVKPEPQKAVVAQPAAQPVAKPDAKPVAVAAPASEPQPEPIAAPEPVVAAQPAPKCDVNACEAAYRSFTPADCTYQPSDGPRRLCTKGTPPAAAAPTAPSASAQAACNVSACSRAYISFDSGDCTYQPSNSPRRLCEK